MNDSTQEMQEQSLPQVLQGNRAQVIYENPGEVDESLEDLDTEEVVTGESVDSEELPELDDLPLDPEVEEEEFVEGSPRFEQFKSDFTKAFGLPLEEARDLVMGLKEESTKRQVNEQKYELSASWNVPVPEVEARLAVVYKLWSKLPADKQKAYDSTKGAEILWDKYTQQQSKVGSTKLAGGNKLPTAKTTSRWLYTQKQIDNMDEATYSANADKIMLAYAQGKVKR